LAREQRRLAAILAADVVGYSRLMGLDESGTLARLQEHRKQRLEPTLARHGGRLVKLTGDGALAEFPSAVDAVSAAIEFQQQMAEANRDQPEGTRIVFRIGMHLGDLIVDGDDLYGDGVNITARLEAEAPPGGIVISGNVHDAVAGRLKATFDDLGKLDLKNIERPVPAFRIGWRPADWRLPEASSRDEAHSPTGAPSAPPDKPSIAVRPFFVLSEDKGLEFLADGLAEDVITLLARVPGFFLISRSSSLVFRNRDIPLSVISRQLGVRYVVEGSVRSVGDRIRVSAQLSEAVNGRVLWSGKFEVARSETFELQDDIARGIIVELEPALTRAEIAVIRRQRPENVDAWGFYHQAAGTLAGKGWNEEVVREAMGFLQRALDLDGAFALARAQLALLWGLAQNTGILLCSAEQRAEALFQAERAITADAGSSEVLGYAGCALADLGQIERGREILYQAVEIDPSNAQAEVALGAALAISGNFEGGIAHMQHGIRLSPRDRRLGFWGWALGMFLLRANRPKEALEEAGLAARRDPSLHLPRILEALAQVALGDIEAARTALRAARRLRPVLTLSEIEASNGKRAAKVLTDLWAATPTPGWSKN
jgi:adenylate cyclase